jgi:hypothetical protein
LPGKRRATLVCALALWVAGTGAGFARLLDYATTPGETGPAAARWPASSALCPDPDRANLVLLAHPHCPCTGATLDELERLLARCHERVTTHVLFYRPGTSPQDWEKTALWRRAAALPGAHVQADDDGVQARVFGATTSGHVLLFHSDGRRLFSGGITNARGHAGASLGSVIIRSLLETATAGLTETPVYGCPLTAPRSPACERGLPCRK